MDGPTEDKLNDYINSRKPNNMAVNGSRSRSRSIPFTANGIHADTVAILMTPEDQEPNVILFNFLDDAASERLAPARWVAPIAGAFLLSLAFIMVVNGRAFYLLLSSYYLLIGPPSRPQPLRVVVGRRPYLRWPLAGLT